MIGNNKICSYNVQTDFVEKVSPFLMYPEMTYRYVRRKDCSQAEIRRLMVLGTLTEVHDKIMKTIGHFGCLNSYLLRTYLYHESGERYDFDCSHMRRLLKVLVMKGFLVQYELQHMEEDTVHGSPFIYTLSGGGIKYLKIQGIVKHHPFMETPFCVRKILQLLAINQFHITLLQQYGRIPMYLADDYYGKIYETAQIPITYRFRLPNKGEIFIFLNSVRGNDDEWTSDYLTSLRHVKIYTDRHGIKCFFVLTVCESEYNAMECARKKNCESMLREMDNFYITDTSILTEKNIFDRLIEVIPKDNYSHRNTFRLELVKRKEDEDENKG